MSLAPKCYGLRCERANIERAYRMTNLEDSPCIPPDDGYANVFFHMP
jgi:hypothetical protein